MYTILIVITLLPITWDDGAGVGINSVGEYDTLEKCNRYVNNFYKKPKRIKGYTQTYSVRCIKIND